MKNLTDNIGHIVIALATIAAAAVLAVSHTITGAEAIGLIAGAAGFTMGGSVASSSVGAQAPALVAAPTSRGTSVSITANEDQLSTPTKTSPLTLVTDPEHTV